MRQLRPPASSIGGGSKKLHAKAAAEKQQSITLVNQSFDEQKIVVLRSDASDKTAKQSEAGYPRVDTIFVNTSAFLVTYLVRLPTSRLERCRSAADATREASGTLVA
jgi:hypothetical protein